MVTIFTLISFVCILIMLFAFIQARMKLLALFCLPLLAFSVGVLIDFDLLTDNIEADDLMVLPVIADFERCLAWAWLDLQKITH